MASKAHPAIQDPNGATRLAGPVRIDKLVMALYQEDLSDSEVDDICATLNRLCNMSKTKGSKLEGRYRRGSAKGDCFQKVYIDKLPSKTTIKFALKPKGINVNQRLQITCNPGHMDAKDAAKFYKSLRRVLGHRVDHLLPKFKVTRVDTCLDLDGCNIGQLIIRYVGARSQSVFYVHTQGGGNIQTIYMGSVSAQRHAVAYDQDASDEYKQKVGEKVMQRTKVKEDAEVTLGTQAKRTRLEVRNVFKTPIPLSAMTELHAQFNDFEIYDFTEKDTAKLTPDFLAYLDSVRLRGHNGAKAYLIGSKGGKKMYTQWLSKLNRFSAKWWVPAQHRAGLADALAESAFWKKISSKADF